MNLKRVLQRVIRWIHWCLLVSHRWVLRNPKKTVVAFVVAALVGAAFASQLRILLIIDDMIDRDFRTYDELTTLNEQFTDRNNLYVVVRPQDGKELSLDLLCDLKAWTQKIAVERTDIRRILSTFGAREAHFGEKGLTFDPLLNIDCGLKSKDQSEAIRSGLTAVKASPWGAILTSNTKDDVIINIYLYETLKDKNWFSEKPDSFDISLVGQIMEDYKLNFETKHPEVHSVWGGVASFQFFLKKGYDQTGILNLLTVAILIFLLWFFFGSWKSSFLFLLSYMVAILPVYGMMAYFGAPIDVLSNSLAMMVLIASLEDFIFVSYLRQKESRHWRNSFRQILVPGFFTSLTTVIGFDALGSANLDIIRRFGLWAGWGAALEFVTVFYFLPALLQVFPSLQQWTKPRERSWDWIDKLSAKQFPAKVAWVTLVVFILGLFRLSSLYVSDTPESVFPKDHPVQAASRDLEQSRGWRTEISLVFKDFDDKAANQKILDEILHYPLVKAHESPWAVDQYLIRNIPPDMASTALNIWNESPVYRRMVNPDHGSARVVLYVQETDIVGINKFYQFVQTHCGDKCFLGGTLVSYGEFGERVLSSLIESLGMSLILVSIIILLLCYAKGIKRSWALLASALWGPLALIFIFAVFQVPIFYVTSIFASILIGLAGDTAIQFIYSQKNGTDLEEGADKFGPASIFLTFSMMSLTMVLFLSYFAPMKTLAMLMLGGFTLSIIGELWVLKAFLRKK